MCSTNSDIISTLKTLQYEPLSIIRLSGPVSTSNPTHRSSGSSDSLENPSPASLEADLLHYKDLFSKLRFSYLEQVTKEKFLRAIVGDPPLVVEASENIELETQLVEIKAVLKEQKDAVTSMVKELEERGRELSRRYETVELQTTLLDRLPSQIEGLKERIGELRAQDEQEGIGGGQAKGTHLPLDATVALIGEKQSELAQLDAELKSLQQALPQQTREMYQSECELEGLKKERDEAVGAAREAMRRREDGGDVGDEFELRGRWLRGCGDGLRGLLGVEA